MTSESSKKQRDRRPPRRVGRRRLATVVLITVAIAIAVLVAIGLSRSGNGLNPAGAGGSTKQGGSLAGKRTRATIAWNPSHQDDNGAGGWHEYAVCGDIAKRTMALLPDFTSVLAWETGMGLTSRNDASLQSECDKANAAHAQVFVAIHVNGGAGSGFTGEYHPGDSASARFGEAVLKSVAATMNMTFYYVRPSALFVLDPSHNQAPIRVLFELGDNVADRALLTSAEGRQKLAAALAKAVEENIPSVFRYEQGNAHLVYAGRWTTGSDDSSSGGSFSFADARDASVTATFTGTQLSWIARRSASYGKANVTVDGGDPVAVDLYSASTQMAQKVWETGTLTWGTHTVKIEWTGANNQAASGTGIDVDAVDVTGGLR